MSASSTAAAYLPKEETGVLKLLQSTPEADGRGVLVAVLDTGCDLAAAGLQKTSDGRAKYVDFLDCTGGGDIDTSKTAKPEGGIVTGVSGRKLKLGTWAEGVDEFHIGAVPLYSLLPGSVKQRVKAERKAKLTSMQHAAVTEAQRAKAAVPAGDEAAEKAAQDALKQLSELMGKYEDAGPLLDVLVFRGTDGTWRAVVGTVEVPDEAAACLPDGAGVDLAGMEAIAPYGMSQQVGDLGFGTSLSFCVQIYDDGATLQIVVDAGSHGTHVAGIVAANFDDTPELNGVAPGAQILACKIGDGRLDSAETGTGLVRALIAAKRAGCDLINLSYGEPFWEADTGRISQTFTDAVRKWGMAVFTSAGNDGPALSSLGAPGHLSACICVGAYISPKMMVDQYSMLPEEVAATSYSFSSRGPTPDGFLPSLCAPGGAIAPIPRHTLQGKAQYHGTSMSSPNACGVAACVLSALRAQGVAVGPIELRRALENTATPVETADIFAQGRGLINAPAAIAYAMAHHGKPGQDVEFEVSLPSRAGARGLYLRDAAELAGPHVYGVQVRPLFEHAYTRTDAEVAQLVDFEVVLRLATDVPWLVAPESLVLTSAKDRGSQGFTVKIDPVAMANLSHGAHFARVAAHDARDAARGPLFSLPVTLVVPNSLAPLPSEATALEMAAAKEERGAGVDLEIELAAGAPVRKFLIVPEQAEWASVKLTTGKMPRGPHTVILHAVPSARGDVPNAVLQVKRMLMLREHSEEALTLPVRGGSTLELCTQLSWLSNPAGPVHVSMRVEYHSYGLRGAAQHHSRPLRLGGADHFARAEVGAPLRTERLAPQAELATVERALRPSSSVVSAGSAELDMLPPSDAVLAAAPKSNGTQIHAMTLTYKFEIAGDKDEAQKVVPRVQALHAQLYDSPLDSALWRLEAASSGEVLAHGGLIHDADAVSLPKGSYAVQLLLRHTDPAMLDSLKELPLLLRLPLSKPIGLTVLDKRGAASTPAHGSPKTIDAGWMRRGAHKSLYVCTPTEGLPSWLAAGDVLLGELAVDKEVKGVGRLPIVYEALPAAAKKDDGGAKPKAKAKDDAEKKSEAEKASEIAAEDEKALQKALLDARLSRLSALRTSNATAERYDKLAASIRADEPQHLPLLLELLARARQEEPPTATKEAGDTATAAWRAERVGKAADAVVAPAGPIDPAALAQYFGLNHEEGPGESDEAKEQKKKMDEQRKAIRLALLAKAEAIANADKAGADAPKLTEAVRAMKQWVAKPEDLPEEERDALALTLARYEHAAGRPASAIALLRERLAQQPHAASAPRAKAVRTAVIGAYRERGWLHWASNAEELVHAKFPPIKARL